MSFYNVEMFLILGVFKLNIRMVRPLSLSLVKSTDVGVVLLAKDKK